MQTPVVSEGAEAMDPKPIRLLKFVGRLWAPPEPAVQSGEMACARIRGVGCAHGPNYELLPDRSQLAPKLLSEAGLSAPIVAQLAPPPGRIGTRNDLPIDYEFKGRTTRIGRGGENSEAVASF